MEEKKVLRELATKKIVVGILARDCETAILNNIPRIERLGAFFKDYKVVVLENDSKDHTKEVLTTWMNQNTHVYVNMSNTGSITKPKLRSNSKYPGASEYRIKKMAILREQLFSIIKQGDTPDYCMFIDIDIENFSVEGLINAIAEAPIDWGGLFANGTHTRIDKQGNRIHIPFQYDYFAYIPAGSSPEATFNKKFFSKWYMPYVEWTLNKKIMKSKYVKCISAFNGIGIYKWDAIKTNHYTTYPTTELAKENCTLCEHIPFNLSVVEKGYSNYICRYILVDYGHRPNWDDGNLVYRFLPSLYGAYKMCIKNYLHYLPRRIYNYFKNK